MDKIRITCPYCFEVFDDDQVHFRSSRFTDSKKLLQILPAEAKGDINNVRNFYTGPDKDEILRKYEAESYFAPRTDRIYENFWSKYNGTTEEDPADNEFGIKSYQRRVLDPHDQRDQEQMIPQNGNDYYIRERGMAVGIKLKGSGPDSICHQRVCPRCHNPLPNNYGLYDVKFISVIGITGAGKTVYLSQLLDKFGDRITEVGMTAPPTTPSIRNFIKKNKVQKDMPLPGPTPPTSFQQPLIFQVEKNAMSGSKKIETIVIYDIAGEMFDQNSGMLHMFAPFVAHSDGVILLIDPYQFEKIADTENKDQLSAPITAINAIHDIINNKSGSANPEDKVKVPIAVCVSKCDLLSDYLDDDVMTQINDDYSGIEDSNNRGMFKSVFDTDKYNRIGEGIHEFIIDNDRQINQRMGICYTNFAFFALTAIGCNVITDEVNHVSKPEGPLQPKRIADPIYWLFYKFGYIQLNGKIYNPVPVSYFCPECGSTNTIAIDEEELEERKGLFKTIKRTVNRVCNECGHKYFDLR